MLSMTSTVHIAIHDGLADWEPGHLLAELVVRGISRADRMATIALEALTVEE